MVRSPFACGVLLAAMSLGLLGLSGCPAPDPHGGLATTLVPDQFLDYNEFVCGAQPVLVKRCSYLGCHGDSAHALRIYSPGKLRYGDIVTRADLDAPITAQETELNFESASGMVYPTSAADRDAGVITNNVLLLKPLAVRFGGSEHHGIGIFPAYPATTPQTDPEYLVLSAWAQGKNSPFPSRPHALPILPAWVSHRGVRNAIHGCRHTCLPYERLRRRQTLSARKNFPSRS